MLSKEVKKEWTGMWKRIPLHQWPKLSKLKEKWDAIYHSLE